MLLSTRVPLTLDLSAWYARQRDIPSARLERLIRQTRRTGVFARQGDEPQQHDRSSRQFDLTAHLVALRDLPVTGRQNRPLEVRESLVQRFA